ncbi:MAG: type II secretion system F family protein [Candidatus Makaraimicrobium thalassicum]|nr:MAG: type II secretion system F family protein [Candidatus Omnitrophota bacterium]
MPKFVYTAKDKTGRTIKGDVEASDRKHALDVLRGKELLILKLEETRERAPMFSLFKLSGRTKVSLDELVIFSRQMATMTDAGITIVTSLDTLAEQVDNPAFKKILQDVRDAVNTGTSFSDAMIKYTSVFSSFFVNMIRAGESSGTLDDALDRVASYLEKSNALQKKIKSAMTYPAVVTFMAFAITLLMILKVIPVFKDIFSGFGAALPAPTQFMIDLSDAVRKYFWLFGMAGIGAVLAMKWYINTDKGREKMDGLKLKLPVFGPLFKKVAISKFTRTLSTLVKSGVPILSAFEIVAKTSGNVVVEKAVIKVRDSVREGEGIAKPLEKSGIFPPIVTRMISVGEKSGELEKMLTKIADFFDEQVDTVVDALTSLIEPLIIVFLGVVIGGIVICMFLPIFKISTIINF